MRRFYIFLLCLLLFCICFTSVSFASVNYTNFVQWDYNGDSQTLLDDLFVHYFNVNYLDFKSNYVNETILGRFETFDSTFVSSIYPYYYIQLQLTTDGSNKNQISIWCSKNVNFTGSGSTKQFNFNVSNSKSNCNIGTSTSGLTINATMGTIVNSKFLFTDYFYYSSFNTYVPSNIDLTLTYNNFKTDTIEVHYNNTTENFIKADYSYNVSSWKLGTFTNFVDSGVDELYGYLMGFAGFDDYGSIWSDKIASFTWNKWQGLYSNYLSFKNNEIWVNPSVITQYQGYTLYFTAYKNGVEQTVNNQYTYLYFVPYGSDLVSGDLISSNFNHGLDWSFINSIQAATDTDSDNLDYILKHHFSGDYNSGDLSGDFFNSLGYIGPSEDEPHYSFIHQLFEQFISVLRNNTNNIYIDISVHGTNMRLYPSDFRTPDGPILAIVQAFLVCGFIVLVYQTITKLYFKVLSFDLSGFLKNTDVDFSFFM